MEEEDDKQLEISISKRRKSIKPTKRIESNPVSNPDPDPKSNPRPQKSPNQPKVKYKECQKNHAASSGGHVIDGCGEFMSSGEEGSPESFLCAACECHRSFHRKEINGVYVVKVSNFNHQTRPVITHQASPIMMSFGGGSAGAGAPAESSTEDLNKIHHCFNKGFDFHQFQEINHHHPKKRFRTKFNKEQKEKMMEFAEKIKWRINKQEDEEVNRFCSEINVKRQVFKVWMHNHKQHQHQDHQNQQQNQEEEKSNKI